MRNFICIQIIACAGYISRIEVKSVKWPENQMLRFPGKSDPDGAREMEAREDARLLGRMADGDQGALGELYRRRGGVIYSLLLRMLGEGMETEEAMQDVFVLIWRRAGEHDPLRSSPLNWMIMIARGRAIDQIRSRSRRQSRHTAYEQDLASLELEINGSRQTERDELADACAAALNNLPEPQAQALQLAFFRGWTHEEIAQAAGEPLGTIKARIRRGLLALRNVLKEHHA